MPLPDRFRSLLAQSVVWIVLPLSTVMFAMIAGGVVAYRQVVTSLLLDRDRQLATLSATRVSEALQGYARVLGALAADPDLGADSAGARAAALGGATDALAIFNAGVVMVDRHGAVLAVVPAGAAPVGATVAGHDYFQSVRETLRPSFSSVLTDARTGEDMIVIAVPVGEDAGAFRGALLGAIHLHNTPLSEPVRKLIVGDEGFAYLVDGRGRVIFHPEPANIGADFGDRPFVQKVIAGESGGTLWHAPTGQRLVQGYAPVEASGWGLVVREPWDSVVAPAQLYGLTATLVGLGAVIAAAFLLWRGVRRITAPVSLLAAQTSQLAAGEAVEPIAESGLLEIDALERAFGQMAAQIASYRAGLRRYVGAITRSQEEERRRIARELHDETAQSLLAILRRLELYQAAEDDPARLAPLAQLQTMVADTLRDVRQISRDLRPLALEDLGLVPAMRTLIGAALEGDGAAPRIRFDLSGPEGALSPEQELALYRITQEALTNVRKHAGASHVRVGLSFEPEAVRLEVSDDGAGFAMPASLAELAQQDHFGLMGIQERVWAVGGRLGIQSAPGEGTRLHVTVPRSPR